MKTKTIKIKNMRTIILLLLFVSGFAYAQPPINNPAPYSVCDDNGNGFAAFDISVVTPTLIIQDGTLVSYHLTLTDSQAAINAIDVSLPFTNTTPLNQTLYIRAWDVASPNNPSFSTLSLAVSQKPIPSFSYTPNCIGNPITITTTVSIPGSYSYSYITPAGVLNPGNVSSFTTTIDGYYSVTVTDTASGCVSEQYQIYVYFSPLPLISVSATSICEGNPANISTTGNSFNPTYTWTVPVGATNPGNVPSFSTSILGEYTVVLTDNQTGCVSNQVSATVTSQTSTIPTFSIQSSVCSGFILPTTSINDITGTWSPSVMTTGTYEFTPSLGQCASGYSTFITVEPGANANQAPDLVVVDNPFDGFATFDLTVQSAVINNNLGVQIDYFPSLSDAENNINLISNPAIYTNVINPQTIGVRVFDPSAATCANITSFDLVVNNQNNVYIPNTNFKSRLIALGVDANSDNEIQFTEANTFNNELNVSNATISDLTGIEAFTNITILNCNNNNLTSLNINNLTNLTNLDCSNNQIPTLNVSNLTNLKILICVSNLLTNLDVSTTNQLEELNCSNNQLTAINVDNLVNLKILNCNNNRISPLNINNLPNLERLDFVYNLSLALNLSNLPRLKYLDCSQNYYISSLNPTDFPLLEYLNCSYNPLMTINVSGLSNLNYLGCAGNQLTTLNINGLNNLNTLIASGNSLTTINVTNLPSLTSVSIDNNQLTTLDFTGSNNLNYLYCNNNLLNNINITGLLNLNFLYCQRNQLTTLDFTGLTGITGVLCDNNLLTSLDFSTATSLQFLSCSNNNLNSINIKNNNPTLDTNSFYSWSQNPNLAFVCADESKFVTINQILNQSVNVNNGNVVFNSYCSFVPGGFYNTISGQIKLDANNNGCDTNDLPKQFVKVKIDGGSNQGTTFTDLNGNYKFYTQTGSFNITPETENPTWYSFSPPTATISFANTNENISSQDFCMIPNGSHQDLEIVIEPIDVARPDYNATYKIVYRNKGNLSASGSLNFNYNDALLDFTSATIAPSTQNTGVLSWNFFNLLPFESRSIYVTLKVNSSVATPPVNVGTILNFNVSISPVTLDENLEDNQFIYNQTVVDSYVPNAITCIQGVAVSVAEIGEYLHYVVNFENTGNYLAQNVVVRTVIDITKFDITTLQLLSSSHHCYTRITGNIVEFIFENINLEGRSGNPPVGGHGDVLFRIKTLDNLVTNDIVLQRAGIYFDYNNPVVTNDAETIFSTLNNPDFEADNSVKIYPNPASSIINIVSDFSINLIEFYDIQGRILETVIETAKTSKLDITNKSNGIYFLKIKTDKGIKVEKIVKE